MNFIYISVKTDYWKSNDRKFCDFCKCWIADNKPSISFHEGGKRHKRNVAKRITEISLQSAKDEKAKQKVDQQFRQMEEAAMKAYAQDISNGSDFTSRSIQAITGTSIGPSSIQTKGNRPGPAALPAHAIDPLLPPIDILEEEEKEKRERMKRKTGKLTVAGPADSAATSTVENSMWCEAKSDEGHTYYWNVKTGESVWTEPKEGYMTLEEYNRINNIAVQQQQIELQKESTFMRTNADEIVARYKREKLKNLRPSVHTKDEESKEEERENFQTYEEPGWSAKPLGQWQTVEEKPHTYVDLQLPTFNSDATYEVPAAAVIPDEPPVKKFKEKTVTSLDDSVCFGISDSFKKRKSTIKRNARQRLDDD